MQHVTILEIERWTIPQLTEVIMQKMNKGDIQAEFSLNNSACNKYIQVNLKQLFIIVRALSTLSGKIELLETTFTDSKEDNPLTRELLLLRDGERIKDLSHIGITHQDIQLLSQAKVMENRWNRE